ncbi:MAG: aminopeptidase P family protein [Deltaproteobacteria bacterium]|nr:aminopeptidase P family protein [Deltaproteobacteria bacterium]
MELITKEEIENRISRFQRVLAKAYLDGAFILQNVDIFYFSGTLQASVLFIPREGSPILMVQKALERAQRESPLETIVRIKNHSHTVQILRDFGINILEAAGLEIDVLPVKIYFGYRKNFPKCRWLDISGEIRRLRMIKSTYEIDQIRRAAVILNKGFTEIGELMREGMTELEIDGWLALIARREGHMGILRMRGWNQEMMHAHVLSGENGSEISYLNSPHGGTGNTPAMAQGAGNRRIKQNEPIGIDYGIAVNGYTGDQFRTFVIGNLSKTLEKAHDCSRDIHRLLVKEIKPGVCCADIYNLAVEEASSKGYGDFFMGHGEGHVKFVGHGIGLEIDEYPIITPRSKDKMQVGMVVAIEPKFVFPGKGVVGLEDDYLITPSGLERLTLTDQILMQGHI